MASYGKATLHFDGRHIHSANNLTVYMDGDKICSYDGGRTCSVDVKPGSHTIKVLVYNDSSESTQWLGPFDIYVEADTEYDLAPGASSSGGSHTGSGSSAGTSSDSGGMGCGSLIFILIVIFIILRSCT